MDLQSPENEKLNFVHIIEANAVNFMNNLNNLKLHVVEDVYGVANKMTIKVQVVAVMLL